MPMWKVIYFVKLPVCSKATRVQVRELFVALAAVNKGVCEVTTAVKVALHLPENFFLYFLLQKTK